MAISLPHDIIEPAAIGWWPLAPGWWMLLGLILLILAVLVRWFWRRRRKLAPLRQALREQQQLARQWQQQRDNRATNAALSALLKRVARHYYPHEDVAALSGSRWQEFLLRTGAGVFDAGSAAALTSFYQSAGHAELTPPLSASARWLLAQRKRAAAPLSRIAHGTTPSIATTSVTTASVTAAPTTATSGAPTDV